MRLVLVLNMLSSLNKDIIIIIIIIIIILALQTSYVTNRSNILSTDMR